MNNLELIQKAEITHQLSKAELVSLLTDETNNEDLFIAADRVRKEFVGDDVHLRGIIEFSNICKRNCMYCGLRHSNKNIERYRLKPDEIIKLAKDAAENGYKSIVLQSGEDDYYNVERMQYIIRSIKKMGVAVTLSLGEKTFAEYKAYKEAGADRYLIRIETTDKALYEKMDPRMSHDNRLQCITDLRTLGYEVGTGDLIGLPGQTPESLADDILYFKAIDADMIGLGPFIANADTPLADYGGDFFMRSLKVMALVRLLLPDVNIPATTAMESIHKMGRIIALQDGANVVMPNVTEGIYRKLYALYPGKICVDEEPDQCQNCISGKISSIGRGVSTSLGFRQKVIN